MRESGVTAKNGGVLTVFLLVALYAGLLLFFTIFYRFRIPVVLLAGAGITAVGGWWTARDFQMLVVFAIFGAAFCG